MTISALPQVIIEDLQERRDEQTYYIIEVWPWESGQGAYITGIDRAGAWHEFYILATKKVKLTWDLVSFYAQIRPVSSGKNHKGRSLMVVEEILSDEQGTDLLRRHERRSWWARQGEVLEH